VEIIVAGLINVTERPLRFTNTCSVVLAADNKLRCNILKALGSGKRKMATSDTQTSGSKPTTTTRKPQTRRKPAARKTTTAARKPAATSYATSTQPKTRVEQVQQIAERAVLVPVGASLIARDDIVSSVRGLSTKYRTRASLEREFKRFERRGATARNRFERQVRRTRTKFERELRQRRTRVERSVKQNRRRLEREVRSVRRDLEKQSGTLSTRVEKIVSGVVS
jgi:hypothetical protein